MSVRFESGDTIETQPASGSLIYIDALMQRARHVQAVLTTYIPAWRDEAVEPAVTVERVVKESEPDDGQQ